MPTDPSLPGHAVRAASVRNELRAAWTILERCRRNVGTWLVPADADARREAGDVLLAAQELIAGVGEALNREVD